jgi:phosphomannomutase
MTGEERHAAKRVGLAKQDQIMEFFKSLAQRYIPDNSPEICNEINSRLAEGSRPLPCPKRICFIGDGTLLEYERFWCLMRASGTDAFLRYYIEGEDKEEIDAYQRSLINIRV